MKRENAAELAKEFGFSYSYFYAMKRSCPEKYSMVCPSGHPSEKEVVAFIENTRSLIERCQNIYYELTGKRSMGRFCKTLVSYGLFGSIHSARAFFNALFGFNMDKEILSIRSSTVGKMESICEIYKTWN